MRPSSSAGAGRWFGELLKAAKKEAAAAATASRATIADVAAPPPAREYQVELFEEAKDANAIVVLGTGLVECIVAGAAARVGRRVVHRALLPPLALPAVFLTRRRLPAVDPNDFYGGDWASFQLEDLVRYARSSPSRAAPLPSRGKARRHSERFRELFGRCRELVEADFTIEGRSDLVAVSVATAASEAFQHAAHGHCR